MKVFNNPRWPWAPILIGMALAALPAQALAQVAPRLPPHLQNVAGIVATAAGRARVARTKAEVFRAVHDAIAAIHKDIELVKAEDPDNLRATRGGDFVAETLNVARFAHGYPGKVHTEW